MGAELTPTTFDAGQTASQIEQLAHSRMDTANSWLNYPTGDGLDAARDLGRAWQALTVDQRREVAGELTQRYHNGDADTLPVPTILTNLNGEMIGVEFDAAFLDWHLGPTALKVIATDGTVMEKRANRVDSANHTTDQYITEYSDKDPYTNNR